MDFAFSEDQQAFGQSARALFGDWCTDEALRAHDTGSAPFMQALWGHCVSTGLHAMLLGESSGGLGLGMTDLAAVLEEQGRALALVPLAEHQLAAAAVERFVAPDAAPTLAPVVDRAASGEGLLALSLDALAAPRGPGLHAREHEGALLIGGLVPAVSLGAQAHSLVAPVWLNGALRLICMPLQGEGLRLVEGRSQRHLALADVHVHGLRLSSHHLLAPGALGWVEPRWIAGLAAQQLGVGDGQLARTVEYISQRKQFGRVIGSFQLVAGQMADCKIALEALRSAQAQLLYRLDAGLGCQAQALSVKVLAAQAAHAVGHKAQHVHGGIGVDVTYPIHRYQFWCRALANSLGGSESALERLGDWLADNDCLGWKYDLPEDTGAAHAH